MPSTVNGIGTHYYGKKNRSVRQGVCNSCHRQVQLESYDTRLWFVIVFIPIIPLGRKRIMDSCPVCQRHYAAELDQWTAARQLEISSAKDNYRSAPTLENAFQAHIESLRFRSFDEAAELRKEFEEHHAGTAELWSGLAAQLELMNEHGTARELYQRAFDLDPSDPMARNGVALARLNEGKLDECRTLLSHLMEPGAGQLHSMAVMDYLAAAYQKQGEHDKALELCEVMLREHPQVANNRDFRKFIQKSEKKAGRSTSILPEKEFSIGSFFDKNSGASSPGQRKAVIWGGVLFAACVGLAIHNHYIKGHRTVRLYNALSTAAQVSIDGGAPVQVAGQSTVTVPEGHHQAKISGPVDSQVDFDIESGFFDRWFSTPVWIIDVGGGSVFAHVTVYYSQMKRPSDSLVILGQPFISYPHVDYVFTDPPDSIRTKKASGEIVKTAFQKIALPAVDVVRADIPNVNPDAQLRFAETHLAQRPISMAMSRAYLELAYKRNEEQRASDYFKTGLAARPVDLQWHRSYQTLRASREGNAAVIPEYEAMVKADPTNADLLYLRARVDNDWQRERDLLTKVLEINPNHAWAWRAIGYADAARTDWNGCLEAMKHVPKDSDANEGTEVMRRRTRIALGDFDGLTKEMKELSQKSEPQDALLGVVALYELNLLQGKTNEAAQALQDYQKRVAPQLPSEEYRQVVSDTLDYMAGKVKPIADRPMPAQPELAVTWIHAALASGQPEKVQENATTGFVLKNPANLLALALAWQLKGDANAATQAAERTAARGFASLSPTEGKALLLAASPPTLEQLNNLVEEPDDLALLGAWIVARFPEQKTILEPYIRARVQFRSPPALLIEKVLGKAPKKKR